MTETASLVIKVDSSGAAKATSNLDKLDRASGRSERAANKLGKAWGVAIGLISSAVIIGATRAFIRQADAMANMSAKLKLVTGSVQAATAAQRDLFDLSQKTSADLEATTDLYVKLGQSSKELAGNHALLLGITEKVSKALVISGADAASSAAVIRQFSQAMAAGALRGDEFISVMEGAPRLARAIADGMNTSVGSLRKLAAEGKLTSEAIIKALEDQGAVLDKEFGEMPLTVSRATQQVRNALTQLIGDTDKTSGATKGLAEAVADMARVLEDEDTKRGVQSLVSGLVDVATWAADAAGKVGNLVSAIREYLAVDADKSIASLVNKRDEVETTLYQVQRQNNNGLAAFRNDDKERELQAELDNLNQIISNKRMQAYLDANKPLIITADSGALPDSAFRNPAKATGGGNGNEGGGGDQPTIIRETTEATRELTQAQEEAALMAQGYNEVSAETTQIRNANREAAQRAHEAVNAQIDDMRFELSLMGLSNEAREREIALRWAGRDATAAQRVEIAALADAMVEARDADRAIQDIHSAFVDLGTGVLSMTGSAGDAFEDFADRIKRISAQLLAEKAVRWLMGAFLGGGTDAASGESMGSVFDLYSGNGFGFAKGGVPAADLSAYSGSIVNKPTYFANGGNVMGEAGPEGIFPLKRGRDGKLGVVAMGGGDTNVEVRVINNSGAPARTEESTGFDGRKLIEVIIGEVDRRILGNGSTGKAVGQRFGLQPVGVNRG